MRRVLHDVGSSTPGRGSGRCATPRPCDPPRSAVDSFVKDLGIVLETGDEIGFPLPVASAAHEQFKSASQQGLGREDDAAVVKVYADRAGLSLPTGD